MQLMNTNIVSASNHMPSKVCFKGITWIQSFNPPSNLMREVVAAASFYRGGN